MQTLSRSRSSLLKLSRISAAVASSIPRCPHLKCLLRRLWWKWSGPVPCSCTALESSASPWEPQTISPFTDLILLSVSSLLILIRHGHRKTHFTMNKMTEDPQGTCGHRLKGWRLLGSLKRLLCIDVIWGHRICNPCHQGCFLRLSDAKPMLLVSNVVETSRC